jgi:hypothetical protein
LKRDVGALGAYALTAALEGGGGGGGGGAGAGAGAGGAGADAVIADDEAYDDEKDEEDTVGVPLKKPANVDCPPSRTLLASGGGRGAKAGSDTPSIVSHSG